jgi:predicted nucleic acid-binding protein
MSVLVDTSVWIRFLSNRAPYASQLDELLSRDEAAGHDFVYGELLIGDKGGRRALLADYARMDQAPVVPHSDVVAFVRDRKLHLSHARNLNVLTRHATASGIRRMVARLAPKATGKGARAQWRCDQVAQIARVMRGTTDDRKPLNRHVRCESV